MKHSVSKTAFQIFQNYFRRVYQECAIPIITAKLSDFILVGPCVLLLLASPCLILPLPSHLVNKGVLSIPLLGKAALSPFAQVVVYTLMPSGEVLADSEDFPVDQCFKNRV